MTESESVTSSHKNRSSKQPSEYKIPESDSRILRAVYRIAKTDDGQVFFRWLMQFCGFKQSSLTMGEDRQFLHDAIAHNESLRIVWIEIRKLIPVKLLNKIEMEFETDATRRRDQYIEQLDS